MTDFSTNHERGDSGRRRPAAVVALVAITGVAVAGAVVVGAVTARRHAEQEVSCRG